MKSCTDPVELARLLGAKRVGDEFTYRCPSHDDNRASLTWKAEPGHSKSLVMKCHTGCTFEQIADGFIWQHGIDINPPPPKNTERKKKIVSIDPYRDWDGTLAYEKIRFEPKDFRIRRPGPGDEHIWNMKGVRELLLRLPEIKVALESGQPIFVVEGEKDVRSLEGIGLVATCNTHGAGKDDSKPKWTDYHARFMKGPDGKLKPKLVVVLADNDNAGRAHARAVAVSLRKLGIKVKVIDLPGLEEKGDVTDYLRKGGTKQHIIDLVKSTPEFRMENEAPAVDFEPQTLAQLMAKTFPSPRWAIEDLLPEGLTIMAGAPKLGKSWLCLDIGLAVSRGSMVLGDYQASRGEVLILALEDNERRLQNRFNTIASEDQTSHNAELYLTNEIPGMALGGITALDEWLQAHPECRLVIIDTLQKFIPVADKGTNAYQADYSVGSVLQKLAMKHGIALLVVHHMRKAKAGDALDEVSGSVGYTGAADAVWVFKRGRTENQGTLLVTGRDIEEMQFSAEFDSATCRWALLGDSRQVLRRQALVSLQGHFGNSGFTYDMARAPLGVSLAESKRKIAGLLTSGYVEKMTEKIGKAFQFRLTDKFADTCFGGE